MKRFYIPTNELVEIAELENSDNAKITFPDGSDDIVNKNSLILAKWNRFGDWEPHFEPFFTNAERFVFAVKMGVTELGITKDKAADLTRTGNHRRDYSGWADVYEVEIHDLLCELHYKDTGGIFLTFSRFR